MSKTTPKADEPKPSQVLAQRAKNLHDRKQMLNAEIEALSKEIDQIDEEIGDILCDVVACL